MLRSTRNLAASLMLTGLGLGCTKLGPEPEAGGNVAIERVDALEELGSVPAAWGTLVSANADLADPQITRLFFQDDRGTVRVVFYDTQRSQLWHGVAVIRRQ